MSSNVYIYVGAVFVVIGVIGGLMLRHGYHLKSKEEAEERAAPNKFEAALRIKSRADSGWHPPSNSEVRVLEVKQQDFKVQFRMRNKSEHAAKDFMVGFFLNTLSSKVLEI